MQPNGYAPYGQPVQQPVKPPKPPKPPKSEAEKEKTAKTVGMASLIVAGVGFVAVAVLLIIFLAFPVSSKYRGAHKKGFSENVATSSDISVADDETEAGGEE
jgi:hypothetical protein